MVCVVVGVHGSVDLDLAFDMSGFEFCNDF